MYNANKLIIKNIIFERATYNSIKRCVGGKLIGVWTIAIIAGALGKKKKES